MAPILQLEDREATTLGEMRDRDMTEMARNGVNIFDIDCDDQAAVEELATVLETTPEEVQKQIAFAQQIVVNARNQEVTDKEMLSVLLSVMAKVVGAMPSTEQVALFVPLCNHLMQLCTPSGCEAEPGAQFAPADLRLRH